VTAVAAAGAASAGAATVDVGASSSSATTIRLNAAFTKGLRAKGVRLTAGRPATLRGSTLRLPVSRTRITTPGTRLTHGGTLRLRTAKRSVTLKSWRTTITRSGLSMGAVVGKQRRTVFTVKGGKASTNPATGRTTITRSTVRLTAAGASALRSGLKVRGVRAGVVGRATGKAAPATPLPKPITPTPTPPAAPAPAPGPAPTSPIDPGPAPIPAPVATPCPSPLPEREAVAGTIGDAAWTVRRSWIGYLKGLRGCVVGTDGAGTTAPASEATPRFAVTGVTSAGGITTVRTQGTVWFLQPAHFIDTRVKNPTFVFAADGSGHVVADGQGSGPREAAMAGATETATFEGVRILEFAASTKDEQDGTTTFTIGDATVSTDGAAHLPYAAGETFGSFVLSAAPTPLQRSGLTWTQTNVFDSGSAPNTNRTFLGYTTGPVMANGTAGPEGTATGDTVTPDSTRGPDARYAVRFPATSSTFSAVARTGEVRLGGVFVFNGTGHRFRITVENPRVVFDGDDTATLFASGSGAGSTGTPTYDDSQPLFGLDLSTATTTVDPGGTVTIAGMVPSLSVADRTFPANYGAGSGPNRTPNTFGSFSLTVPSAAPAPARR
jgi:hypothetical protein